MKSFLGRSFISDLEVAVGKYIIYSDPKSFSNCFLLPPLSKGRVGVGLEFIAHLGWLYRNILQAQESEYELYLAIAARVYNNGFQKKLAKLIIETNQVKLLVFDSESEVIERWIN